MIRVGILGTGFGKVHAGIYSKMPNVEIAGIFGRNSEKLEKLHVEFQAPVTSDIDDLISAPGIDLIDVCLSTNLHREYVVKALQHGKHVFCETPVCYTFEDAEAMKHASEQYKKDVFVDLFFKCSAPYRYAIDTVHSRALGKPQVISLYQKSPPHWGSMGIVRLVQNFMLHNFDFVTELMGLPTEVIATGIAYENSHVVSTLKYPNSLVQVESSFLLPLTCPFNLGYTIICEGGTITYDGQFGKEKEQRLMLYTGSAIETITVPEQDDYEEVIRQVLSSIENGISPAALSLKAATESLKIVQATIESIHRKSAIKID